MLASSINNWKHKCIKCIKCISCVFLIFYAHKAHALDQIGSPEIEVLSAFDRLEALKESLESMKQIAESEGFGDATDSAKTAFNIAWNSFSEKEYLSALRNIRYYLDQTNTPSHVRHADAYLIAARSAQNLGKYTTAYDYYIDYLGFSTKPGTVSAEDMRSAVAELLELTATIKPRRKYQLERVLSSLISIDVDPELKPEILYLAAKTASNFEMSDLAKKWLKEAQTSSKSNALKIKGSYYEALILISNEQLEPARQKLEHVLSIRDMDLNRQEYAIAQLALARIAYTQGDYETATTTYLAISDQTNSYTSARYELILSSYKEGKTADAYKYAKDFLERNPNHKDAKFTKSLVSYLGIKSVGLTETDKNLQEDVAFLYSFMGQLEGRIGGGKKLVVSDLLNVKADSSLFANQSPYIEKAIRLFERLEDLEQYTAKIDGRLTGLISDLSNFRIQKIEPKHFERTAQLKKSVYELLDIGHRLSQSEFTLAEKNLSSDDKIKIDRSVDRRISLLSEYAGFKRYRENIRELGQSLKTGERISTLYEELYNTNAHLSSLLYNLNKTQKKLSPGELSKVSNSEKTMSRLLVRLGEASTSHKSMYLENIYKQSPLRAIGELMTIYSLDLINESKTLSKWRLSNLDPVTKELSWSFHDAWMRWYDTADKVFHSLKTEELLIKEKTQTLVTKIDNLRNTKQKLLNMVFDAKTKLSTTLGENSSIIINHYTKAARDNLSEKQKWRADIEWLKFQTIDNKAKNIDHQYKKQRQSLRENYIDQIRGVER